MRHVLIRRGHLDTETDTQRKDNVKRHRENALWVRMEHLRGSTGCICDTRLSADDQRLRERPGADSPSWPQKKPILQMPSAKISAPGLGVNKFLLFSAAQSHWFLFSPQGSVLGSLCLYSSSLKDLIWSWNLNNVYRPITQTVTPPV